ncbi:MAG: DUF1592 domain-containing protein [Pirellula sp.]
MIALLCSLFAKPVQASPTESLDERLKKALDTEVIPILKSHCGSCHMNGENEAGVNFDDYKTIDKIREHTSTWEQIRGVVRAEAMPPPDNSNMSGEERKRLSDWIQAILHDVDCQCEFPTPGVTIRRLNQIEYDNTTQDLFGIDTYPSKQIAFVSDDVGNGFDNQGEVLSIAPIMMEKYLQAASLVAKQVIITDREKLRNISHEGKALAFGSSYAATFLLAEGTYDFNVRMRFGDGQNDKCFAIAKLDGQTVREWDVESNSKNFEFTLDVPEGEHVLAIQYESDESPDKKGDPKRKLYIENIRSNGPRKRDPAFPRIHRSFVVAYPEQRDAPFSEAIGPTEASRRVFTAFLPKAYRRAVDAAEIESVVKICEAAQNEGFNYLESLQFGLQGILASPKFLFRSEKLDPALGLDDYSIANRLSYFLWSSMPDEELMNLAAAGELRHPDVLRLQVNRMLEHPKSIALVQGFFGQWLGLRNLNKIEIDKKQFTLWNNRLRDAMIRETELFCHHVLQHGSVDELTTANYSFMNPRMADFYGVSFADTDPADLYLSSSRRNSDQSKRSGSFEREDEWIRVELPKNRQGILTQAAVLALTSNPSRTSPVKRGKWILENMLGDPPPSAPPNVPSLEQAKANEKASLREQLEVHRSNPSCAGCHKIMDPIGLGLENFDAIGRWRDQEGDKSIDAQGELVDGSKFTSPAELVTLLGARKDQILENLTKKMMVYAIGRSLQRVDRCAIEQVLNYVRGRNRSIRGMVEAIVLSDTFLQSPTIQPSPTLPSPAPASTPPTGDRNDEP